ELLHARQRHQRVLVDEVLRADGSKRGLVGAGGVAIVLLGLPRVADADRAQEPDGRRPALRERRLVRGAGGCVLAGRVLQVAGLIRGLRSSGETRMRAKHALDRLDRPRARVRRRLRGHRLLNDDLGLRESGLPARLLSTAPGPGADGDRDDQGHHPADLDAASPNLRIVEPGTDVHGFCADVPRVPPGSTHTSPLTDAPSAAEKLPVLSVPVSTPFGRISTRVAADRLPRTVPPITMARALMFASTCRPSATSTRPVTLISPSNFPATWKSPSPLTSPRKDNPAPMTAPCTSRRPGDPLPGTPEGMSSSPLNPR